MRFDIDTRYLQSSAKRNRLLYYTFMCDEVYIYTSTDTRIRKEFLLERFRGPVVAV
jgi:hypothetical protein